jgi:hypothetical protein
MSSEVSLGPPGVGGGSVAMPMIRFTHRHLFNIPYGQITHAASTGVLFSTPLCYRKTGRETKNFLDRGKFYKNAAFGMALAPTVSLTA